MSIRLGKLNISPIGQGTGFDFKKINEREFVKNIRLGIELGMNFIDTAENYGNGESERLIGKAINGVREKVIIASKFLPEHSSSKEIIKACDKSLKRLKTDFIDLYQFHWPNPKVKLAESLKALLVLEKVGKIKYIGVGNFSLEQLINSQKFLSTKLVSFQSEYNLFEKTIEQNGILKFCQKNNLITIAASPLNQGQFNISSKSQTKLLKALGKKYQKTITQIILSWIINHKFVIAIPKTLSKKHLYENAQVINFSITIEDIEKINKAFLMKIEYIPVDKIKISKRGERNSKVFYQTLNEALKNRFGFSPSPEELSREIKQGGFIKPVKLIKTSRPKNGDFALIAGGTRYWAWVIAYGKGRPIPAYVRSI